MSKLAHDCGKCGKRAGEYPCGVCVLTGMPKKLSIDLANGVITVVEGVFTVQEITDAVEEYCEVHDLDKKRYFNIHVTDERDDP